eukprot:5871385-Lingulodinium_polyedra.AAC.1
MGALPSGARRLAAAAEPLRWHASCPQGGLGGSAVARRGCSPPRHGAPCWRGRPLRVHPAPRRKQAGAGCCRGTAC